jgi:hypothetical protein
MSKRALKWPVDLTPEDRDAIVQREFLRAVRSIHIGVSRETSTAAAIKQLSTEGIEDEQDAA